LNSPYAAPEQYEGKPADARSDIFSFGAVLYEMVTGKRAFEGKSRAVLVAAIATADPDPMAAHQPRAPRGLQHIVDRCLAKDPFDRWQTAHDLLVQLRWMAGVGGPAAPAAAVDEQPEPAVWSRQSRLLAAGAAALAVALAVPAILYLRGPGTDTERFEIRVPVRGLSNSDVAISPDGETLVAAARPNQTEANSLYLRSVRSLTFKRLGGTDGAAQPFWSPDGRFIAFFAEGRLKKVSVDGGAPQNLSEAPGPAGGSWNRDGVILFGSGKGLFKVSAEGGKPDAMTTVVSSESGHYWPEFLPDGRHFLYLSWAAQPGERAIYLGDLGSKEKRRLLAAESNAVYAEPGYILFHREASLFALPFDAGKLAPTGDPAHVADEVSMVSSNGRGSFDASRNGVLVYNQGSNAPAGRAMATPSFQAGWVERSGRAIGPAGEAGTYGDFDASPDGKLIAITRQESGNAGADVWIIDWQRAGVSTRLTMDPADDLNPVWSPDGARVAFTTYRKGNADIYVKNANGSGAETPLLAGGEDELIEHWSSDGKHILYLSGQDEYKDIYALPQATGNAHPAEKPFPVVQGRFRKNEPQLSHDGKWLAYTSDESGSYQVYVVSFPSGERKIQVSKEGGGQPRWRRDGKEIYFRAPDSAIYAAAIKLGDNLESSVPTPLFTPSNRGATATDPARHQLWAAPDGQRFLLRVSSGALGGSGRLGLPTAPPSYSPPGSVGGSASRRNRAPQGDLARGLTVIRNWSTAIGKGKP
jgi:Tol biopolymer transport system component